MAFALAACGSEDAVSDPENDVQTAEAEEVSARPAPQVEAPAPVEGVTPIEERVATLGLLNKRNNTSINIEIKPGETVEEGSVRVTLRNCERTAPWEIPQEQGAFVQVDVLERGASDFRRIFSGWLFKNSPSVNVVEHPIYDVWVKNCEMAFPGEE